MALFESYERRIDQINAELQKHGISSIEEAKQICDEKGVDAYKIVKDIQPICFENAAWAYVVGAAIAIKDGVTNAADAAEKIGLGPVSYTHLDVYKRQMCISLFHLFSQTALKRNRFRFCRYRM